MDALRCIFYAFDAPVSQTEVATDSGRGGVVPQETIPTFFSQERTAPSSKFQVPTMAQASDPDSGDPSRGATANPPWQFFYLNGLEREPSSTLPEVLASLTKSCESDRINKSESPERESQPEIHTQIYVFIHKSNEDPFWCS